MKQIQSDALVIVKRMLGLAGGLMDAPTSLDDGTVSQVLDVTSALRRGRAGGAASGWFYGVMQNVHPAADTQTSVIGPYAPTQTLVPVISAWPGQVPVGFDVHVIGGSIQRTAGAGALTGGSLFLAVAASDQAWGVDQAGARVTASPAIIIARWTGLDTGSAIDIGITGDGSTFARMGLRMPRGSSFNFRTVSAAAATYRLTLLMGLFPESLGQDVAF